MSSLTLTRTLGVAVAAAALTVLAACGSGTDTTSSDSATAAEAVGTAASPSAQGPLTRENFVDRLADAQLAAKTATMKLTTSAQGQDVVMNGQVSTADNLLDSSSKMTMDAGVMAMDLRMVKGILYLKLGEMTGGKYVKIDLTDKDNALSKQYGSFADQADPTAQLKTFSKALVSFEDQGDGGKLDGVSTTRYALVLDTAKLMEDKGMNSAELGAAKLPKQLTYTLYVGDDDLLRRMTFAVAGSKSTIDWSKWGEPVDITAPAKAQVTDMSALTGAMGSAMGGSGA